MLCKKAVSRLTKYLRLCPGDSDVTVMEYIHQTIVQYARAMAHPRRWSRDDVYNWLNWCVGEYGLSNDLPDRFLMNGLYD